MKKSLLLAALLAATATTAFAQAQSNAPQHPLPRVGLATPVAPDVGGPPPGQPALKPLTRDEALKRAAERFDAEDTNKDGVLSPEEQRAAFEKRMSDSGRMRPGRMAPPPGVGAGGQPSAAPKQ